MFNRRAGRLVLVIAMTATITAVVDHRPPAARADDPQVLISAPPAPGSGGSIDFQVSSLGGTTTVVNPGGTTPVTQVCVPNPSADAVDFCLGASDQVVSTGTGTPVSISGFASQPAGLPGEGMDWLVTNAESAVAIEHGVQLDDMVRTYGRPEIRTYIAAEILTILNKKLYGETLTDPEEAVYDEIAAVYKQRQVDQATWALQEYNSWNADPCAYVPPNPPVGSGLPVVPNAIRNSTRCSQVGALSQQYTFTNGTPPVSTFDTWAAYRHPTPSMSYASNPTFRQMSVANASAIALSAGTGLALIPGGAAGFGAVAHAASVAAVLDDAAATAQVLDGSTVGLGGTGTPGHDAAVLAHVAALLPGWGDRELVAEATAAAGAVVRETPEEFAAWWAAGMAAEEARLEKKAASRKKR